MATADLDLSVLELVTADLTEAVASLSAHEWSLSTPCPEWVIRDLVDHITGGNWYTTRILDGDSSEKALATTMSRFADGSVSAEECIDSVRDQLRAFTGPGALARSCHHVAGQISGHQVLRLRLHDLIIHTWDLDESRCPPADVPEALAVWGIGELLRPDSLTSIHFDVPSSRSGPSNTEPRSEAYLGAFGRSNERRERAVDD